MARLVCENTGFKADQAFKEEIEFLIRTIATLYRTDNKDLSFFDDCRLNLEDIMTLLDIDFRLFSRSVSPKSGLVESRQLRILKDLLARTLNYSLEGPICKKHLALAERMKPADVVLSFNYDILIDNALFELRKISESNYRMNFFKVNQDGQWKNPDGERSGLSLFKLHGSMNWVRCGLCGALLSYRNKKQVMYGACDFRCPRCSSDETYAERMMIPPVQSKNYQDKDMQFLWIQADNALKKAFSKIVCIGYSFSPLDFDMALLMRRFRANQSTLPQVEFTNPDKDSINRFKDLLSVENVKVFKDLSMYLRSID
jgi:hypothetical protein